MVLIFRCCEELGEVWIFPRFRFYSLPCGILLQALVFALLCESREQVRAEEAELVLGPGICVGFGTWSGPGWEGAESWRRRRRVRMKQERMRMKQEDEDVEFRPVLTSGWG